MVFDKESGRWSVVGDAAEIAKTSERQEILDALKEAGEPMGGTELANVVGKKRDNVQHLLARMVREGKVAKVGKGKYTPISSFTPFTHDPETGEIHGSGVNAPSETVHSVTPSFTHTDGVNAGDSERCERSERGSAHPQVTPINPAFGLSGPFTSEVDPADVIFRDEG